MWLNLTVFLILLTISNLAVTVYLHRVLTHRSIRLHRSLEHFFRLALWMLTPFPPKIWVAVHRYHHKTADSKRDPHSPIHTGFWPIMIKSVIFNIKQNLGTALPQIVQLYSKDLKDSKLETFYLNHPYLGKFILLVPVVSLCGVGWGIVIWLGAISWMHLMEERIHVVLGHYFGYRNFNTNDNSKNIIPWAFFLFGEELHNNHHAKQNDWSFRSKWYEIDPAAIFIQLCIWLKLAYPLNKNKTSEPL